MRWWVVPVDFSACAANLVDEARGFATAFGDGVVLLHVIQPPRGLPLQARISPPDGGPSSTVEGALRRESEAQLDALSGALREARVPVRVQIAWGPVVAQILAATRAPEVRGVVMGTHGRTGFARAALGSVAEEVVRHAEVPVVTVRSRHQTACAAAGCAACVSHRSTVEVALDAEADG